jgi:hypothetical protein
MVYSDALTLFAFDDDFHLGVLSSAFHWWWAVTYASTLRTDIRYTATDCFETFPLPVEDAFIPTIARELDQQRREVMDRRREGLTSTYHRVHDHEERSADIERLREVHRELDHAVANAYTWSDLSFVHDFYPTRQGERFTVGPASRTELLDRLLELNHERHAAEAASGPQPASGRAGRAGRSSRRRVQNATPLWDPDQYEEG